MARSGWFVALLTLVLAGGGGLVYYRALSNGVVWDDPIMIREQLPYFSGLSSAFFPPQALPEKFRTYYRPLVILSFQLDRTLVPQSAAGKREDADLQRSFHRSVIIGHALTVGLVLLLGVALARAAGREKEAWVPAAAGALLFAAHPVHAESVGWISGRTDVWLGLLTCGTLLLFLAYRRRGSFLRLILCGAGAFGTLLAKESGVALLVLVPALDWVLSRHGNSPKKLRPWWVGGVMGAATLSYAVLRLAALGSTDSVSFPEGGLRWGTGLAALGWYGWRSFWPVPHLVYVEDLPGSELILAAVGMLVLLGGCLWAVSRRKGPVPETFLGLLFFSSLAPALWIPLSGLVDLPVAERYLYVPSIGLCLAAGFLFHRAAMAVAPHGSGGIRQASVICVALLISLPAAWAAFSRCTVWKDNLTFWSAAAASAPRSATPALHLGAALAEAGRYEEARKELGRVETLTSSPETRARALLQTGISFFYQSRYPEAIECYRKSLSVKPDQLGPHFNWGMAELALTAHMGQTAGWQAHAEEGIRQLEKAVALAPDFVPARFQLGRALWTMRRVEEGQRHLEEVLRLAPAGPEAREARVLLSKLRN